MNKSFQPFFYSMNRLDNDFREQYFHPNRHVPYVLYQYTNETGMKGILESKTFWATHFRYLNDDKEIVYADEMMSEILDARIGKNALLDEIYHIVLGKDYGDPSVNKAWDYDLFVISFSQEHDDLNQWRAYGDDGKGYAIGIRPWDLKHKIHDSIVLSHKEKELCFIKVSYDEDEQRQLILEVVEKAEEVILRESQSLNDNDLKLFPAIAARELSTVIWQFVVFYKHRGFKGEHEWRVVKTRWGRNVMKGINNDAMQGVKYRTRNIIQVPYLELDFTSRDYANLLPIDTIYLGPKLRNTNAQFELEQYLLSLGYDKNMPDIRISDIPYR
jgi:hypothetical protein